MLGDYMNPESMAKQGFILGIVAIIVALVEAIAAIVLFLPGLVFSILGLKAEKKSKAIIGIVLNLVALALWLILYLFRVLHPSYLL